MTKPTSEYSEIIDAFGSRYLSGKVNRIMQGNKFCMVDNFEDCDDESTALDKPVIQILYPVRITMSFFIYCKKGTLRTRIQQRNYYLGNGDILLIFAGQILEDVELSSQCKVIYLAIDSEFIMTQIRNKYGLILRDWVLRAKEPTKMHTDTEDACYFESLCESIKFIIKNIGNEYSDGIVYGFTTIFANLLTSWYKRSDSGQYIGRDTTSEATNAERVLLAFHNDIHHFSDRHKRVEYYAKRQGLSTRQFSRLVKEASGKNPSAVINEYLLLEAKSLLRTGSHSVHQVSELLGFVNDSFFNRWFKKSAGTTPGAFMKDKYPSTRNTLVKLE